MWMGGTHRGAAAAVRRFWIGDYRSILWLTSYRWGRDRERRRMDGGRLMDINVQCRSFLLPRVLFWREEGERADGTHERILKSAP